jgi:hypothetical protein
MYRGGGLSGELVRRFVFLREGQMSEGSSEGCLRGLFEVHRFQEEKDAYDCESTHYYDDQQKELPSGGVGP